MGRIFIYMFLGLFAFIFLAAFWGDIIEFKGEMYGRYSGLSGKELSRRIAKVNGSISAVANRMDEVQSKGGRNYGDSASAKDLLKQYDKYNKERNALVAEKETRPKRKRFEAGVGAGVFIFLFLWLMRRILIMRDPAGLKRQKLKKMHDIEAAIDRERAEKEKNSPPPGRTI